MYEFQLLHNLTRIEILNHLVDVYKSSSGILIGIAVQIFVEDTLPSLSRHTGACTHTRSHSRSHSRVLAPGTPPSEPLLRRVGVGGGVTSGLQSRGERLERVARSSPRKLEAHSSRRRSRAPPSPLHPLSRCPPAGKHREPPGELKVVSGGGRRGVLQSWHALKTATRTETTRRRSGRAAPCAASPGCWRRPLHSSQPSAAAGPRPRDSGPGRARPGETPSPAHFAAAPVWGMRARWLQVAAEQLPVGERGEARGRQLRPEDHSGFWVGH
uniref:uncharacterized protein LOC118542665 n=1 Tax=Halichoerus grypus TaxID=9711 RepID=UPI001658D02A|nr:uncharacterized protein LOC118542665 [Halichoerus grypus]